MDALAEELRDEASFYGEVASRADGPREIAGGCRELLPVWCAKEVNPLATLLVWNDKAAIERLVDELFEAFALQRGAAPASGEALETWRQATLRAQTMYLDGIEDDRDLLGLSVREVAKLLGAEGFSLDHDDACASLPRWLLGKSRLIWNIVICSILGPEEAVGGVAADRSPTAEHARASVGPVCQGFVSGEVLLRRRFRSGRVETVDRLMLDGVCASGLWKVIGGHFDPCAPLPNSAYRTQFSHLGAAYVSSEAYDQAGRPVEGRGDSRFHIELSIEVGERGGVDIVARDLGSKNGSCVRRMSAAGCTCYAFPGRRNLSAADWAERLRVPEGSVRMVSELALERGDVIQLADSCFELI